jgi:hypothetical protein
MSDASSRRLFLQKCFSSVLQLSFVSLIIESCTSNKNEAGKQHNPANSSDPCSDYSDLSEADIKKREILGYVQKTQSVNQQCANCNLWLPPASGEACGKCQLFKGPVPASAICTYWTPKTD